MVTRQMIVGAYGPARRAKTHLSFFSRTQRSFVLLFIFIFFLSGLTICSCASSCVNMCSTDGTYKELVEPWATCKSLLTPETLLSVRRGEVLSPTTILKTDHFYTGINNDLESRILGAPNFRGVEAFDIYGVAQPTRPGLMTIFNLLGCSPLGPGKTCVWISTREEPLIYINDRPFVLRSLKRPFENIQTNTGIKPRDLEEQEDRLRDNILIEASRSNGLIVIHDEKENGQIFPCLLSLESVKTSRQVFEELRASRYSVNYHRLPLTPSQSPTVDFIDDVFTIINQLDDDRTPLIFSCGMGLARTTLSMVIGVLIKRSFFIERKQPDPLTVFAGAEETSRKSFVRLFQVVRKGIEKNAFLSSRLEQILTSSLRETLDAVLKGNLILINDLTAALAHGPEVKAIVDKAIDECEHVVNIRESVLLHRLDAEALAFSGNYSSVNITSSLRTGTIFLERYFSLIAFGEFLEIQHLHPGLRFSDWLASRKEVIFMFQTIRPPGKPATPRLSLFRPLQSIPFKAILDQSAMYGGMEASDDMDNKSSFPATPTAMTASTVSLVNSADSFVINNRSGRVLGPSRVLKNDHWFSNATIDQEVTESDTIEVTPFNFRRMSPTLPIYGTSQPTRSSLDVIFSKILIEGASESSHQYVDKFFVNSSIFDGLADLSQEIIRSLKEASHHVGLSRPCKSTIQLPRIIWINLREEPVVYIGDEPYVLRDQYATLRNIRKFSGINRSDLESLEERLADDVRTEHDMYNGSLLLHHEESGPKGRLVSGQWTCVNVSSVQTPLNVFKESRIVRAIGREPLFTASDASAVSTVDLTEKGIYYYRVPMTAEEAPELVDFDSIMNILVSHYPRRAAVLMNCQIGAGRSTIGMVISAMILQWLYPADFDAHAVPFNKVITELENPELLNDAFVNRNPSRAHECPAIRNLVRVLDKGTESVERTDALLELAATRTNCSGDSTAAKKDARRSYGLKESIDRYRLKAELAAAGSSESAHALRQGVQQLKRYFLLIAFQAYLFSVTPSPEKLNRVPESFSAWLKRHQEIMHMIKHQLDDHAGLATLTPEHQLPDLEQLKRNTKNNFQLNISIDTIDAVLSKRNHNILQPGSILKQDHFPGCHLGQLSQRIEGAPNFRPVTVYYAASNQVRVIPSWMSLKSNLTAAEAVIHVDPNTVDKEFPEQRRIYGLAIPTESAIRTVLDKVGAGFSMLPPGQEQCAHRPRRIIWTSLREEPVLYIRGSPYVLRSIAAPYKNMEATGINRTRVLKMEHDMRDAARKELQVYHGNILLHAEELKDRVGHLVPIWESMSEGEILTPDDIFRKIASEGFAVDYDRLPITDEQPPMPRIFDSIFERYRNLDSDSDAMFNCQMGRGRTTTGMIISSLIEIILHRARFMPRTIPNADAITPQRATDKTMFADAQKTKYLSGQYLLIDSLVRVLGYGKLAKYLTDVCIDQMDLIQNLRTAIYYYKVKVESKFSPDAHDFEIALQYLVRYFYLITFTNYLLEREAAVGRGAWKPFSEWLENRKEVTSLVREKLHEVDFS